MLSNEIIIIITVSVLICAFVYYIRSQREIPSEGLTEGKDLIKHITDESIKANDIVLAKLSANEYGFLWNGLPNIEYSYSIKTKIEGREIASGKIKSASSIFKIKGIPLVPFTTYLVSVGRLNKSPTTVEIQFEPMTIDEDSLKIAPDKIECNCSMVPTFIEIIVDGKKIPLTSIELNIEPPGIICHLSDNKLPNSIVITAYNGDNTVTLLSI
jgi:hypothetical protein